MSSNTEVCADQISGTDAATQKDAWTSFSGQHVDKELQNNPKGDTTVHQAAKMQPGEDQSVWQDEKKQLLNDPNAPKTITGKDTAAANPVCLLHCAAVVNIR